MSGFEMLQAVRRYNAQAQRAEAKRFADLAAEDADRPGIRPGEEGQREGLPADVWRRLTR
jgi:hypothetical protein